VIFDFDGVIVESTDIKVEAFRALYQEHGEAVVAEVLDHHTANGGISRRKKIRHCHRTLLGQELDERGLDVLCERFSRLVEDAVVACAGVPGALDLLGRLKGRMPLFVVSGTPDDELRRIVARRDLGHAFTEVFGSPPEKPPIIRDILARFGLRAEQVLFIGDALTDYHAARETGIRFVGRVDGVRDNPFPADTPVVPDLTGLAL
jgi:phosphoglycolate phosphatase-like HAD superfamily hydrolase